MTSEAETTGRILGTEIEFGISVPGAPLISSIVTSTQVIRAYDEPEVSPVANARWDYDSESPMRDARGFDLSDARPTSLMDPSEFGITNRVLRNGARFYVDHAHPEYSSPEVTSPRDAVLWDKAGERIMHQAGVDSAATEGNETVRLYKNNVDGKGASYGTHENYLVRRDIDFDVIAENIAPHFVTRQVFTGSGRVGIGQFGERAGFQLSQRADYIEVFSGLETTLRRGIINTRDEPHADDDKWRRLHVIIGDANLAELATYLKIGTTSLVLNAIEGGIRFDDLQALDPPQAVQTISHDISLAREIHLADGRSMTALAQQREILRRVTEFCRDHTVPEWSADVLAEWSDILDRLAEDPMGCADCLDWPAKLALLDGLRTRDGLEWDSPKLAALDIQYSDIDPDRGLYNRLAARGRIRRLLTDEEIEAAALTPPTDTRAWLRGQAISRLGEHVFAAGWDQLTIVDSDGEPRYVEMPDPYAGNKTEVDDREHLLSIDGPSRLVAGIS